MREQKDNSGAMFRNDKKSDKHPDYSGNCVINGVEFKVAAWVKRPDGREPFMSLSFTPKDQKPQGYQAPPPAKADEPNDLPF